MLTLYPYPLPPSNTPIVDPQTGALTAKDGRFLILALLNRTGGSSGAPSIDSGVSIGADPYNITDDWTEFVVVSAGAGPAVLPPLTAGSQIMIFNGDNAVSLNIEPQANQQIDALGFGAAYSLPPRKTQIFSCFTPTQIYSTQLG